VIAEPFADLLGWPSVFLLAALWGIAAAVIALQIEDPPASFGRERLDFGVLLEPATRSVLFSAMICGVALGVMFTYTQPLAMVRGARTVGMFFSGFALFAGCVRLLLANMADRMGRKRVSIAAMLAYGFVLLLTAAVTPGTLFWAGAGLGAAHGILYPALNALAFEHSSIDSRGMVAASFSGAFSLGYALGVLNLGVVADRWGLPTIFIMTAGCTLLGAWALGTIRPIAKLLTK
jgi:predicted MFS family arabinose efflux permease